MTAVHVERIPKAVVGDGVEVDMRALVVLAIVGLARLAEAGPYCSHEVGFAPYDKADLPIAPTIAYASRDRYYGGLRYGGPTLPAITATIDGKRVPVIWNDVGISGGGKIRLYSIRSRATGKLELWRRWPYDDGTPSLAATYTIRSDWAPGEPQLGIRAGTEDLGPYRWVGDFAGVQIDLPAIAFDVRWRATPTTAWKRLTLPVHGGDKVRSEARLGEESCGMDENIPMAALAKGVEIEVRAKLPSGREVLALPPTPLMFVPKDPKPKPQRATHPPAGE